MTLSDAMGILRSTSDQTHKFWTYFQLVTASAMTLAWGATTQVHVVFGLVLGYALFAYLNGLLVNSSQTDARKIWTSIQAYVADMPGEVPEQFKEVPKTNEPQEPKRVEWLHSGITWLAVLVMLIRVPYLV